MSVQPSLPPLPRQTWIAACSHRLQRQWPRVDPGQLEELAATLWQDQRLRLLEPTDAAVEWLRPITSAAADAVRAGRIERGANGPDGAGSIPHR